MSTMRCRFEAGAVSIELSRRISCVSSRFWKILNYQQHSGFVPRDFLFFWTLRCPRFRTNCHSGTEATERSPESCPSPLVPTSLTSLSQWASFVNVSRRGTFWPAAFAPALHQKGLLAGTAEALPFPPAYCRLPSAYCLKRSPGRSGARCACGWEGGWRRGWRRPRPC